MQETETSTMTLTGAADPANAIPPVVLDTTLAELLSAEQDDPEAPLEPLCQLKPNSDKQYGTAVPLSDKYIIHSAQVDSASDLAHLQLENCSHLLMFFAGAMNVIFVAAEGEIDDPTLSRKAIDDNAHKSFGVIQESQRPKITTYSNIEDLVKNHDGSKIRWGFGMDFAERLPWLFHPELVYELNSKRWLAECDLKSANDVIIDCEIKCADHQHKTSAHKLEWYYGGPDCQACAAGVEAETERIISLLKKRPSPYVLKLTQSLSSVGTILVENDEDKEKALKEMQEYLTTYLPRITKANAHLYTTALIVSDYLPGKTMALNFFVKKDGSVVFLGACHQLATGNTGRQATAITYADQAKLEPQYKNTLAKIGRVLHEMGYFGAVGADVMEDEDGKQYVIDLNVRTPLSLVLYLLRGHFNEKRGHGVALVYECVMLKISREELEKKFSKEFSDARIILLGSFRMGEKEQWGYGMILAGKDKEAVDQLSDRILEFEA